MPNPKIIGPMVSEKPLRKTSRVTEKQENNNNSNYNNKRSRRTKINKSPNFVWPT